MLFAEKICQLHEEKQLLQRQISAALEMDNTLYCKIERGDRYTKREQVVKLAQVFEVESDALLSLWLADKITMAIDGDELAREVLKIVEQKK
jgi:transcriptional regulator with XRE-family HTH domain